MSIRNVSLTTSFLLASVLGLTQGCAGDKKSGADDVVKSDKKDADERGDDDDRGGGAKASANRVTMTNSLSNNQLTSHTVSDKKAESLIGRFEGKSRGALEGRISAERLAHKSLGQVMASAKKLAEVEMEKGAGRTIDEDVKLELALAAIGSKNFALAEFYLQELTDSKSPRIKAGAYNALGVVALRDDRVPEAVLYFRESLKAVGNYKPALLNMGFAALKGGDLDTAKKALGDMQSDWFVQYGLITVARIEGNEGRADELCDKVLAKEPNHKAALFNCSLLEYQNKHNFNKAKVLAEKAAKAPGGEQGWDDKAFGLSNDIDFAEADIKRAEHDRKQAEKAKDKEKDKDSDKEKAKAGPTPANDQPQGAP